MTAQLRELYRERDRILNGITNLRYMRSGERKDMCYTSYMNRLNKIQEQIDILEEDRHPTIVSGGEVLELGPQHSDDTDLPF